MTPPAALPAPSSRTEIPAGANPGFPSARGLMLVSTALFIGNGLLVRELGHGFQVPAPLLSTSRFVVGFAIAALPFAPTGRVRLRALLRNPLLWARGIVGGIAIMLYYSTITTLGAGRATFINNTYVLWGAVLASIFLREKLRAMILVGLSVSLAGMALLTGVSPAGWAISHDDALAIAGAICSGIVVVVIRKLSERENTATIFAAQCAGGFLFSAAPTVAGWQMPAAMVVVLLILSGLFAGGGQMAMTSAFRRMPVAEGSLLQLIVPLGIALGGVVFFGERYTTLETVGAAMIVCGCLLGSLARPRLAVGLPPSWQRAGESSQDRG